MHAARRMRRKEVIQHVATMEARGTGYETHKPHDPSDCGANQFAGCRSKRSASDVDL